MDSRESNTALGIKEPECVYVYVPVFVSGVCSFFMRHIMQRKSLHCICICVSVSGICICVSGICTRPTLGQH